MALYRYIKTYPRKRFKPPKYLPITLIFSGIMLLIWVSWPILSFRIDLVSLFPSSRPLAEKILISPLTGVVMASEDTPADTVKQRIDYTNPNVWFPNQPQHKVSTPVNSYSLSIPKLKINSAQVMIGGDSLDNSLVHYGGTGLPGQYGTTVIFGHSTLTQFYDPTNYKTIFSLLPTLKPYSSDYAGDKIYISYDGITYTYRIYDMVVTKPNDLSALEQKYDDSYLTLITCVPPGTYWERLNVKAKLVPLK